jgi:hypothetical protein
VARALLTGWVSRFGCPQTITTDQERQSESKIFQSLARTCGIQLARTTAHHSAANGLVERFHRTLKAAIMYLADQQWTEALPFLLLGIRAAFKEGLQASVAELVYCEPLRIPGELLTPTAEPVDSVYLITEFRQHMGRLRPVRQHATPPRLHSCTATSRGSPASSTVSTQRAGLWNTPTAAPTRSYHGERRLCNFLCAVGLSPCQRTGSSRPTSSTGPTAGANSTRQQQQPRRQHHQSRRRSPP